MIGRVRKSHKRPTGMVSKAQVLFGCGRSSCPARGLEHRGQSRWRLVRRKALLSSFFLREQRAENKISPDCAPTHEPKAETNQNLELELELILSR
jgi:hypothetical protein